MRKVAGRLALLAMLAACLAPPAAGQGPRPRKPYREWTMSEVLHVLNNPPWSQTALGAGSSYRLTARLFSARPVREALVRRRQLVANYDKFGEADRARFDADTGAFLECADCARYYVVTLSGETPGGLLRTLGGRSAEELRRHVSLTNERGEGRTLAHVKTSGGVEPVVMFAFERLDERAAPLVTAANKKLHLALDSKLFEDQLIQPGKFTFEVARITEDGEVVF